MKKYISLILSILCVSCIKNDIPHPVVELYITSIDGNGFSMNTPNNSERTIVLELDETTSIKEVSITSVSYSPDVDMSTSVDLLNTFDMRLPISVTLSHYQDYTWTISANQTIERYFKVENQIGAEIIDESAKTITAYVVESTDLDDINVLSLKLGPKDITTYDVNIEDLSSFHNYRAVNVSYHDITDERWKLYVIPTDVAVSITQADVRATTAMLSAAGQTTDTEVGFSYRVTGSNEWRDVASENIVVESGLFTTKINSLASNTSYDFIAHIDDDSSDVVSATTESIIILPNGNFEDWSFPDTYNGSANKSWFPFLENGEQYWGTGNQGATTLGANFNLTTPSNDICPNSTGVLSANLESRNVFKFATGSIFTGKYLKTSGTNGIIGLGRPFTSRPSGLKGWVKYNCGTIDMVSSVPPGVEIIKDVTSDQGSIFIALGTWSADKYGVSAYETENLGTSEIPMIVDTRDNTTFFDKNSDDIIAYGELIIGESIDEWSEFIIALEYYNLDVKPTHMIIVCSASRYGDYFTGSTKSAMLLDDLELIWE